MSMNGIKGPRGGNLRNGRTTFPREEARRQRAAERQAAAATRTPEEQLKRLDAAGLVATKERLKLAKRILKRDTDAQVAKMQTPEAKKAAREAFNATPKQLGEAAVKAAKKDKSAKGRAGVAPTP